MPFSAKTKQQALTRSGRRCCLCLAYKGIKVEVHHIIPANISNDNSLDNAITLCFDCHSDVGHYNPKHPKGNQFTPDELRKHRDRLWRLVQEGKVLAEGNLDIQYLKLLKKTFDRPAFNTPFRQEGKMEDFNKAIDDTILALNTGVLRTRDNQIIEDIGFGKSLLTKDKWINCLYEIEIILQDVRRKINEGLSTGKLKMCYPHCYCGDDKLIREIDKNRINIIKKLNTLLIDEHLKPIPNILENRIT